MRHARPLTIGLNCSFGAEQLRPHVKLLSGIALTGGVLLALLVGRRLYRRFRGQPDRADLDRPRTAERERR